MHLGLAEAQGLGDLEQGRLRHMAKFSLDRVQDRQQRPLQRLMIGDNLADTRQGGGFV